MSKRDELIKRKMVEYAYHIARQKNIVPNEWTFCKFTAKKQEWTFEATHRTTRKIRTFTMPEPAWINNKIWQPGKTPAQRRAAHNRALKKPSWWFPFVNDVRGDFFAPWGFKSANWGYKGANKFDKEKHQRMQWAVQVAKNKGLVPGDTPITSVRKCSVGFIITTPDQKAFVKRTAWL